MSSYTSPQRVNFAKLVKPVRKDYHHLESNRALPHPLPSHIASEAQDKYTLPLDNLKDYAQKLGENIGNRTATTRHNKDTHFLLGSDDNQMKSENVCFTLNVVMIFLSVIVLLHHRWLNLGINRSWIPVHLQQEQQAFLLKDTP